MATNKKPGKWRKRTQAVRGGQVRTPFQETSEPLILTAGYAYETAEEAEARFKGESPGYQYSRIANPTVTMFEERLAQLEGARGARHRHRYGFGQRHLSGGPEDGRSCRIRQRPVRLLPLCD